MERISRKDAKPATTSSSPKPSQAWTVKRLKTMADVTQTPLQSSDVLTRLAGAVSGFPQAVIDSACTALEDAPQGDFRRLPTPHELVKACQDAAKPEIKQTRWCGRCNLGMVARGKDERGRTIWVHCECNCAECDNSGWILIMRAVPQYKTPVPYAVRCPKGCSVSAEAA